MVKIFSKYIIEYIKKDFDLNVVKTAEENFEYLAQVIENIFEVFLSDVLSKYTTVKLSNIDGYNLIRLVQSDCTLIACLLYRVERAIFLANPSFELLADLASLMRSRTGIELYYSTSIGPGLNIQHGSGIVVGPRYTIGANFVIHQGVTLGQRKGPLEKIIVGDNVTIFAGAKVLGDINIGNNVKIAANAVLLHDALDNSTYVGIPARKLN